MKEQGSKEIAGARNLDAVVFDLGKVLVNFEPEAGLRKIGFSEDVIRVFMKQIFSGLWESYDKINCSEEEVRRDFKKAVPGYESEVDRLWDQVQAVTDVRPFAREWIQSLKERGLKCYVLSNFGSASFKINSQKYDFLELMDGMVISYEIEEMKPSPAIYKCLLERYHINPQRAVFIDDREENVEGARKVGMKGIRFDSYEQARQDLEKIL